MLKKADNSPSPSVRSFSRDVDGRRTKAQGPRHQRHLMTHHNRVDPTHEACAGLAESSHLTGRGHRLSFLKRSSASLGRMTQVNTDAFVMRICYAKWRQRPTRSRVFIGRISGSDPNGIRTRVTAVKGRCPGPLDDRVVKARAISNCCSRTQGKLPASFSCKRCDKRKRRSG